MSSIDLHWTEETRCQCPAACWLSGDVLAHLIRTTARRSFNVSGGARWPRNLRAAVQRFDSISGRLDWEEKNNYFSHFLPSESVSLYLVASVLIFWFCLHLASVLRELESSAEPVKSDSQSIHSPLGLRDNMLKMRWLRKTQPNRGVTSSQLLPPSSHFIWIFTLVSNRQHLCCFIISTWLIFDTRALFFTRVCALCTPKKYSSESIWGHNAAAAAAVDANAAATAAAASDKSHLPYLSRRHWHLSTLEDVFFFPSSKRRVILLTRRDAQKRVWHRLTHTSQLQFEASKIKKKKLPWWGAVFLYLILLFQEEKKLCYNKDVIFIQLNHQFNICCCYDALYNVSLLFLFKKKSDQVYTVLFYLISLNVYFSYRNYVLKNNTL